jgi:hypothetical protein
MPRRAAGEIELACIDATGDRGDATPDGGIAMAGATSNEVLRLYRVS